MDKIIKYKRDFDELTKLKFQLADKKHELEKINTAQFTFNADIQELIYQIKDLEKNIKIMEDKLRNE